MVDHPTPDPRTAANPPSLDELLDSGEIERRVQAGELTNEQASALLQEAARREAAERGTSIPEFPGDHITTGGFGSEQGMDKNRTGPKQPAS